MCTISMLTRRGIVSAAFLGASFYAGAEACTGPAALEARVQARADALSYAALGAWFNENHQADCAIEAFQSALKIDPASKAALDGLSKAQIAAGKFGDVIRRLRAAPLDENLTLDLAAAYRKTEMFDDAARVLTEGLKRYPNSDGLTAALVSLYVHQSHYAAAQAMSEEIARQKPGDIEAQRIYLRTLVIIEDYDAATPLGRKLLAQAPRDADLLNLNGFLERKAGDYQAARKHLEEAVALNPNDYNSRMNLGLVLAQLKDAAGARVQLEKAVELGVSEPQVHFELSKVLRTLGETAEAQRQLTLFEQKLKEESDQALAVLKATQAAEAAKARDNRKAADLYREACAAQPGNAVLEYRLALVLDDLGDGLGERAALEQSIKIDSHFVLAHYALGYLEFQGGDHSAAEEQFRLVVADTPDNAQAWVSLGAVLATESKFQEARDAVAKALKLEPDNAGALGLSRQLASAPEQR